MFEVGSGAAAMPPRAELPVEEEIGATTFVSPIAFIRKEQRIYQCMHVTRTQRDQA